MKSPTLQFNRMYISSYSDDDEDDDGSMSTGRTMSSISMPPMTNEGDCSPVPVPSSENSNLRSSSSLSMSFLQHVIESDAQTSIAKNTYFMDGGNRFISVPTLGNANAKVVSSISRIFEEWLANKLYCHPVPSNDTLMMDTDEDQESSIVVDQLLPILQDHVELVAEDMMNKMKSSTNLWQRKGLDKIMIKIRMGHVYTYHALKDGQPLITQDMEELFQQFPLFVECLVYTLPPLPSSSTPSATPLLLVVENVTINPGNPYRIIEGF